MNPHFDPDAPQNYGRKRPDKQTNAILAKCLLGLVILTILSVFVLGIVLISRLVQNPAPLPPVSTPGQTEDKPPDSVSESSTPSGTDPAGPVTTPPITTPTEPVTTPPETVPPVTPPPVASSVLLPETPDAGQAYLDKIVFLGDSTTYHMFHYSDLNPEQIWAPLSGTLALDDIKSKKIAFPVAGKKFTEWSEMTIAEALKTRKPEIFIVTLGINFSAYGNSSWDDAKKETYFKLQIRNLVEIVKENSPDTCLIFQTIYPTIDSRVGPAQKNAEVDRRNGWILDVCEETGTPMLWSIDTLRDSTGNMIEEYNSYHLDGIHMYKNGYAAVLKYVRTHAATQYNPTRIAQ